MRNKITIGYFYKKYLNLYGDNGNVEILCYRARERGVEINVLEIEPDTKLSFNVAKEINLIFMGGGPDSAQKDIYLDLKNNKGHFLSDYIENDGVGLYVCGSYQLLGEYYRSADGSTLEGLGILDFYTRHFGNKKPRCIGNITAKLNQAILSDSSYFSSSDTDNLLVGFENHGGRTYLSNPDMSLATVIKGFGNNAEDGSEGIYYKNTIGTYSHGPILSKNPLLADFFLSKALKGLDLTPLDDEFVSLARNCSLKLK